MDEINQASDNSQKMDSGEIVVPSIRPGVKREYNMMMKAQSELIKPSREGGRVTRSQNAGSSSQGYVKRDRKSAKRLKVSASMKLKESKVEKLGVEDVGKLENTNVSDSDQGPKVDVVQLGYNSEHHSRNLEAEFVAVDRNGSQIMGADSKEDVSQPLCTQSQPLPQAGGIESTDTEFTHEGGSKIGGASDFPKTEVAMIEVEVKVSDFRNDEERLGPEDMRKLESIDVSDCKKGPKGDLIQVGSDTGHDSKKLEAVFVSVNRSETKKPVADSKESIGQPLYTESPLLQVGGNDADLIHEEEGAASGLGCEGTANGMKKKPLLRYTRLSLKRQDKKIELGLEAGVEESGIAINSTTTPSKLEMKMSKKVELKRIPSRLRDLLETGLLEGLSVRYITGSKRRRHPESELQGVINGTGILCSCDDCKGSKVITPNEFETHANSGNKRPPEYIYLDNGKSLRDVMNACKANQSESLALVIQKAIGRSNFTTAFCINCKELIPEGGVGRPMLLCDSCVLPKESDQSNTQSSVVAHRSPLAVASPPVSSSCQPEVPEIAHISSNSQPERKRQGRLTRKDLRMHKSVLAEDVLPDGTALSYVIHGTKKLSGYKKDGAIFCTCCKKLVSPSQFESHAGFASRRKPYMSIYTSNGVSLHQLSLELSKTRKLTSEENDDLCSICEDGGDLLCCENCPRAFHYVCVGLSCLPQGTWYCKYCNNMFEREKFAELDANAIAAGRVPGVDPLADITLRCIRIVATFEADVGGCAICRGHDFCKSGFDGRTVIICDQCEKEYHVGCLKEQEIDDLKALPENEWFCSQPCGNIHSTLQKLIADGEQILPEDLFKILKEKNDAQGPPPDPEPVIRWRLLSGKKSNEDTRTWLSGAVSIFHDRFDPIADSSTARLDLIPHMVYGRNFKGQDFCGMYCAVLMVDTVVVSAGIVRIFGDKVAELPLVATRSECQGKGYFQSLYFCIEKLLVSLGVKDMVLPAADEAGSLWKNKFGFERLDEEELKRYQKSYQMMIFEGTSVLHKAIAKAPPSPPHLL